MKRSVATRKIYEFGEFQLDPARRRIEKNGENVALYAKAFDALVYLVEHAGQPVSRLALTEALWPKRVVEENNLTQAISALRRVLGDDCIVTLAGRGYQFVADVRTIEGKANGEGAATAELSPNGDPLSVAPVPTDCATVATAPLVRARSVLLVGAAFAVAATLAIAAHFSASREPVPARALVLPFQAVSQEPEHQAYADGLTDELISRLRELSRLRMMGPATSFALRAPRRSVPEIAAEFGVQYVLEGTVGRVGDSWRIRGQLSDARGFSVWDFDSTHASLSDIQDEIVSGIAEALHAPIGFNGAPPRGTQDTEAYNLYLAARAAVLDSDPQRALDLIDRALERDEKFAAAWSMKARALTYFSRSLPPDEREARRRLAQDAADKAISLAPDDGRSHVAQATVLAFQGDWLGAESAYEQAFDLGYTDLSDWPVFLLSVGRIASARERFERRFNDDPLLDGVLAWLILSLELSGQPEAADDRYEFGRLAHGSWDFGRNVSTWIRLGREGESVSPVDVEQPYRQFLDPALEPEHRLALLQRAATGAEYSAPMKKGYLAVLAANLNDTRLASTLLEEAVTGDALLAYLAWLPVFDDVRQMPEFKALLEKLGLVEYWRKKGWPDVCRRVGQNDFACD